MASSPGTATDPRPRWERIPASRWLHWFILAAIVAWFMRGWWNGLLPASPRMEMIVQFTVAWTMKNAFAAGRLPAPWNALEFGGLAWTRFLAVPVYAIPALVSLLSGVALETVFKGLAFVGFAASGIALYEYARTVTGRWQAALVAGAIYATLPYHLQTAADWWEFIPFWALLPLPFLFYELALRSPKRRVLHLGLAALTLGLFAWTSPERTVVSAVWFGVYAIVRELMQLLRGRSVVVASVSRLGIVAVAALGISAAALLPASLELKDVGLAHMRGPQATVDTALLRDYSASPRLLLTALVRRLHIPLSTTSLPAIWSSFGGGDAWYLGWIALALAVLGLLQWRRQWFVWLGLLLGGAALWMSFGPAVPINPFMHLPLIQTLIPFRGLMLAALFGSVLAGLGVITLGGWIRSRWSWAPVEALAALAVILLVLDYGPAAQAFSSTAQYFSPDELAGYRWLAQQGDGWRLWEPTDVLRARYTRSYSLALAQVPRYTGHWIEGVPIRTWEMLDWGDEKADLTLLSVRFAALRLDEPKHADWVTRLQGYGFTKEAWRTGNMVIFENPSYRPFVTLRAPGLVAFGDDASLLKVMPALAEKDLPVVSLAALGKRGAPADAQGYPYLWSEALTSQALVQAQVAMPTARALGAGNVAALADAPRLDGDISWGRPSATRIEVTAAPRTDAILTVAESWYPHWSVRVDGKVAPLLRVDYMLMGVRLSPGMHTIVFAYKTPLYDWLGLAITVLTILALIAWQVQVALRRRVAHAE